ncbi:H-NS family nucleoid-associated regulatory protein [Caballeronia ptereochthonis]|uniref:Histone family protein nucleoid-structuring protein H-NS n=1 Tax=Caballeronia ptereochthonis TaxID=1777144 RepID=A0A158DE18_9BURK|nr:H-NS family nucleoid-associated regulatory protein [Caballeronia ptereochthonis]SAK92650.1 histone family protein nucleoid-structuring protein H-NS [Caballeronia ptereochthonis]
MSTLESIQARIEALQAKADALVAKQSESALQKIHELMSRHSLTISDIEKYTGSGKKSGRTNSSRKQGTVAYQDPKTGATWSGRGRAPAWIAKAKDRSKYAVNVGKASSKTQSKTQSKAKAKTRVAGKRKGKGQPRGPQPALYLDPQTGATWSGRGRAPAWLASVEDRTPFLIA